MESLQGALMEIKSRVSASGDKITTLKFEVHGDIGALHPLQARPLIITIEEAK